MSFIMGIIMTIMAWRNGWEYRALLPVTVTMCLGLLTGLVLNTAGVTYNAFSEPFVLLDLGCITALALMIRKPPIECVIGEYPVQVKERVWLNRKVNLTH